MNSHSHLLLVRKITGPFSGSESFMNRLSSIRRMGSALVIQISEIFYHPLLSNVSWTQLRSLFSIGYRVSMLFYYQQKVKNQCNLIHDINYQLLLYNQIDRYPPMEEEDDAAVIKDGGMFHLFNYNQRTVVRHENRLLNQYVNVTEFETAWHHHQGASE